MKKPISLDITNPKSIDKTISYIDSLRKKLPVQIKQFCSELADVGIKAAILSSSGDALGNYVVFAKQFKSQTKNETTTIMYGRNIRSIFGEDINAAEVSPILMMEYGSGAFAVPWQIVDGLNVGRGTFPGQKHAFDPNGWWYKSTKDGEWHHSYGLKPSYPMQHAFDAMQTQVDKIARRCFRL